MNRIAKYLAVCALVLASGLGWAPALAQTCSTLQPSQVCGNNSTAPSAPFPIPERMQLTSAIQIYVNGNSSPATCTVDSAVVTFTCAAGDNMTGDGTTTAPYQTLSKALSVAKSFDLNGFAPTIVLAYGSSTNYGGVLCTGANVGFTTIVITGDQNSPNSVSILSPNGGEGAHVSDYCALRFQFLVCDNQGSAVDCIRTEQHGIVDLNGLTCGSTFNSTTAPCIEIEKDGVINGGGSPMVTISGCGPEFLLMTGGVFNAAGVNPPFPGRTIAVSPGLTCSNATVVASDHAHLMNFSSSTFTGSSITGVRAALSGNVYVDTGGAGINAVFPGSAPAIFSGFSTTDVVSDGCQAYSPADQSGASLTFTSVNVQYCQYGNLVFVYGTLTYPSTLSSNNAAVSLPVPVPNQSYAQPLGGLTGAGVVLRPIQNTSPGQAAMVNASNVQQTNATLSTKVLNFMLTYPAN